MKAFLLAAGLGTRLKPITDTVPKCMVPIDGRPLLGIWLDGDGPEYLTQRNKRINAVTLADVKRVAEKVLKADRLLVTIVGRPKLSE